MTQPSHLYEPIVEQLQLPLKHTLKEADRDFHLTLAEAVANPIF
jgi:DNA-binding FadR family transcriptional regulator